MELHIAQAYQDWQQMLDQAPLDAVVAGTPNHHHAESTITARDEVCMFWLKNQLLSLAEMQR